MGSGKGERNGKSWSDKGALALVVVLSTVAWGCGPSLTDAARQGNEQEVREQLRTRASQIINRKDESGWAPLHYASSRGHERVVAILLARGADPGARTAEHKQTALHIAASRGYLAICRGLLRHGADANAADASGWTTLHSAALSRKVELGTLLLEGGASPEIRNRMGLTAAELARRLGHLEFAESIERSGGDDTTASVAVVEAGVDAELASTPEADEPVPLTREESIWVAVELGASHVALSSPRAGNRATGSGAELRVGLDEALAALPRMRLEGWIIGGTTGFEPVEEAAVVPDSAVYMDLHFGANLHTFAGVRLGAGVALSSMWFSGDPAVEEDPLLGFGLEGSIGRRWWVSKGVAIGTALRARYGWNIGEATDGWWTRGTLGFALNLLMVSD